jgi:hypothetical protein
VCVSAALGEEKGGRREGMGREKGRQTGRRKGEPGLQTERRKGMARLGVGTRAVRSARGEKKRRNLPELFSNDKKMVTPSPFVITRGRFWWAFCDKWVLL